MGRRGPYRTEALVVRAIPFAETSQVVHLATEDHGLVAAMAKGARRAGGAHEGGLATGAIGEAQLSRRRGAELELLRGFRRHDRLRGLGEDLDRYYAACYVLDLVRSWLKPSLPNPALYRAAVAALEGLARGPETTAPFWVAFFEARAITAAGHRPVLAGCAACGRSGPPPGRVFAPAAGGLVDEGCETPGPRRRLPAPAVAGLARLYATGLGGLVAEPPSRRELAWIRAVHDLFVPHLLERRPASLALLPRDGSRARG